jgi:hypothetical protein
MGARLNTKEVAAILGVTPNTLITWRKGKKGPPFYRQVGLVWYDVEMLREWQRQNVELCGMKAG